MQIIYFGRRDKSTVDIIGVIRGRHAPSEPYAIDNLKNHIDRIPADFYNRIVTMQHNRRMDWQLYAMNCTSAQEFFENMKKMGFKGLPSSLTPLVYSSATTVIDMPENKKMTMVQKLS